LLLSKGLPFIPLLFVPLLVVPLPDALVPLILFVLLGLFILSKSSILLVLLPLILLASFIPFPFGLDSTDELLVCGDTALLIADGEISVDDVEGVFFTVVVVETVV